MRYQLIIILLVVLLASQVASAQSRWVGPFDRGNWLTANYWDPTGVPSSTTDVVFDVYIADINFSGNANTRKLDVLDFDPVFLLGANTLTVAGLFRVDTDSKTFSGVPEDGLTIHGGTTNLNRAIIGDDQSGYLKAYNATITNSSSMDVGFSAGSFGLMTLNNSSYTGPNNSNVYVGYNGNGTLLLTNGSSLQGTGGNMQVGENLGSKGVVTVDNSTLTWSNTLDIGESGLGILDITGGGTAQGIRARIGEDPTGIGIVNVGSSGTTSKLKTTGALELARQGGKGTLNIFSGGLVEAGLLRLDYSGVVNLQGGTLTVGSLSRKFGKLNLSSGTFNYTTGSGLTLGSSDFGGLLSIGATMNVTNNLALNSHHLLINGGEVNAGTMTMSNGHVTSTGSFDVDKVNSLTGSGVVHANVTGTTASSITANGYLQLGNPTSTTGYNHGGTLNVGGNTVLLQDANKAQLGATTTIADGGRLASINGIDLASSRALNFTGTGSATVDGPFTNNGSVNAGTGTITFVDDVNGSGSYAGSIVFSDLFSPGNSPAEVVFADDVTFDSSSNLEIELGGLILGTEYDSLTVGSIATLGGTLDVTFIDGFDAEIALGDRFQIITAAGGFGGTDFGQYNLPTLSNGLKWHTDLSTNSLTLTAVPEPSSLAILAVVGLVGLGNRRRRRTKDQVQN